MEEKGKIPKNVIETEITMGPVHSAAIEPYRVRLFVEDEIDVYKRQEIYWCIVI